MKGNPLPGIGGAEDPGAGAEAAASGEASGSAGEEAAEIAEMTHLQEDPPLTEMEAEVTPAKNGQ